MRLAALACGRLGVWGYGRKVRAWHGVEDCCPLSPIHPPLSTARRGRDDQATTRYPLSSIVSSPSRSRSFWPVQTGFAVTAEAHELSSTYLARRIVPPTYADDGLHIALATIAEVDILTSWNFKHIVHFDKIRRFNAVNRELGYKPIDIYSPREVTHHGEEEAD